MAPLQRDRGVVERGWYGRLGALPGHLLPGTTPGCLRRCLSLSPFSIFPSFFPFPLFPSPGGPYGAEGAGFFCGYRCRDGQTSGIAVVNRAAGPVSAGPGGYPPVWLGAADGLPSDCPGLRRRAGLGYPPIKATPDLTWWQSGPRGAYPPVTGYPTFWGYPTFTRRPPPRLGGLPYV